MSDDKRQDPQEQQQECGRVVEPLRQALHAKTPPSSLPEDVPADEQSRAFYEELIQLRNFIMDVATGVLSGTLPMKGYTAGAIKTLQANLRHLTWQTKMIAAGDFTHRLDFMGEFSEAFNSMVMQLQNSMEIIKQKETQLNAINAGLRHEIEVRKQAQEALSESEAHYRNLTENMQDVVWVVNAKSRIITYISPSIQKLSGFLAEEVQGQLLDAMVASPYSECMATALKKRLAGIAAGDVALGQYYNYEIEHICKDGSRIWVEIVGHYEYNEKSGEMEVHGVTRDISDRRALQLELQRRATIDSLTGIYNRRTFLEHAEQEIQRCRRNGRPMAFLLLDIDHFKSVNDSFGHATGDLALQKMTDTCMELLRSTDAMGRLGGEEFAIYLVETDLHQACIAAERLRKQVEQCVVTTPDGRMISLRVSIGVAELRQEPDTLSDLINRADQALYRAKGLGRNRVEVVR